MTPTRTRFAPSPTGTLHVGNVRIAVFNWLFARSTGGEFILRVEDTDVDRNAEGSEDSILEDLRWLGLDWDEGPDVGGASGPYRQSEGSAIYHAAVDRLVSDGSAYPAKGGGEAEEDWVELSQGEAEDRRAADLPVHVRFRTPSQGSASIRDEVRGDISFPAKDLEDFVILREDGRPTYHLAVVVDDARMGITHVIRGAGHLSNTPKHALLFDALGVPQPRFVHLPTVLGEDRKKLSKRSGAPAVAELRHEGVPADAVVNYLSLLGWSAPDDEEVLSRDRLVELISLERIDPSDTVFDPAKLRWLAGLHLARCPLEELVAAAVDRAHPEELGIGSDALPVAVDAIRNRLYSLGQIGQELQTFAPDPVRLEAAAARLRAIDGVPAALSRLAEALEQLDDWSPAPIEAIARAVARELGMKVGELFHPLREAVIGTESGPGVGAILTVVGRVQVIERLRSVARGL